MCPRDAGRKRQIVATSMTALARSTAEGNGPYPFSGVRGLLRRRTQVVGFQRTYAWEALIQPRPPNTYNKATATNRGEQYMSHTPTITFTDTPRARRTDPTTSHKAADSSNCTGSLLEVMDLFTEFGPMADHELVERHAGFTYTPQRLRTARHELTKAGLVEFTGIYRLTFSNRRARVWGLL